MNEKKPSHAEFAAIAFRFATNTKVIGSNTEGTDDDVSEIILPGNMKTKISGVSVYYPNRMRT